MVLFFVSLPTNLRKLKNCVKQLTFKRSILQRLMAQKVGTSALNGTKVSKKSKSYHFVCRNRGNYASISIWNAIILHSTSIHKDKYFKL